MEKYDDIRDEKGARPTLVICPECNQPGFLDAWPWILSSRDEHATQLLLDGELFKYRCPVCDTTTTIAYDCLYHDVDHRAMIMFSSKRFPESECIQTLDKLADLAQQGSRISTPAYQRRITFNPFEFYEKARILNHNYDDRVIELMKVALKRGMLEKGIIGKHDTLIYERTMDDCGISFIVVGEIPGDVVGVRKGYDFLEKHLRESSKRLDGEYCFDNAWANRFLP